MSAGDSGGTKRSRTVSLVLVAGAAAAALGLARLDPSQDEEDTLVYPSAEACAVEGVRPASECDADYATARAAYPAAAPHYPDLAACESHHGPGHCVAAGTYVPRMAGYLIGRRAEQEIAPQPVYEHAPDAAYASAHGGGSGGYCTGGGARIFTASGGRSSGARVPSGTVRTAFGGFGGTGRSFGSAAHGAGG